MATYTPNYNLEKPAQNDIYNVDVFNSNSEIIDDAMGEINSHLVSMLVVPSASDEMSFVDAVRLKMSDLGIQSFIGEMYAVGGLRYQGFATFNDSHTQGSVVRVAFAGSTMFKYRYNGGTWTKDEYVPISYINSLTAVTSYFNDSFTPTAGVNSTNSRATKTCQIVSMNLYFGVTTAKNGYSTLFTIPDSLKPVMENQIVFINYDTNAVYAGYININGEIHCRNTLPVAGLYVGRTSYACTQ